MKTASRHFLCFGFAFGPMAGANGQTASTPEALQKQISEMEAKRDEALGKLATLRQKLTEQEAAIAGKTTEVAALKSAIARKAGETGGAATGTVAPAAGGGRMGVPNDFLANITPHVVVIEGDQGSGTGFLCHADGEVWVYTAAHVMSGNNRIKVRDHKGNIYQDFEFMECAEDADLVRLKPKNQELDGLKITPPGESPSVGDAVVAIGNSLGAGSLSGEPGKVISIEEDMWEVDTEIIPGNSGGPVLSLANQGVIGIVTHLIVPFQGESSLANKPQTKRYAARLDKKREWRRMPISRFVKEWKFLEKMHTESSVAWACARTMYVRSANRDTDREMGDIAQSVIDANRKHFHVQIMDTWIKELRDVPDIGRNQHIDKGNAIVKRMFTDIRLNGPQPNSGDFSWFHRQSYEDERKWRLRLTEE